MSEQPKVKSKPISGVEKDDLAAAFTKSFTEFCTKLEAVWNPVDLGQAAVEAEMEMNARLAQCTGPYLELERCEARLAYLRAVRQLVSPERQDAQIAFAFARYLEQVRSLWERSDLDRVDPRVISSFGESIAWAGYYASQRHSI